MSDFDALANAWRDAVWQDAVRQDAGSVVVLTGAGLSTASGIPDFRSPGGRWERYQPTPYPDFVSREDARIEYWRYKGETWQVIQQAEPNPAHVALAELASGGALDLLVTQNVDGLHERSGFPRERLVNIHGTDSETCCIDCGARADRAASQKKWEAGQAVPACDACGGALKPATISFGQNLVEADLDRAFSAAQSCDLFLAVGTSLVVGPINQMFLQARAAGATTAILTASETPYDSAACLRLDEPVEGVLPRLAAAVLAR